MKNRIRLIHIAPELPPTVGGVADYTEILSHRLMKVSNGAVEPVLVHAGKSETESIDANFPGVDLSGRQSAQALASTMQELADEAHGPTAVLLEYSGYGYATRGAPLWLARGLRRVCGDNEIPLVTIFHEISASGPVWSSAFWLAPVQRWISRTLLRMSKSVLVNRPSGAGKLRSWTQNPAKISFQPVFSNVGEPETCPSLAERENYAVAFGGADEKGELYAQSETLRQIFEKNDIDRLVDVGPPPSTSPEIDVAHEVKGIKPSEVVSGYLERARFGFAHRRLDLLTKSGVVAAYLAHGVPPVILPNGNAKHPPVLSLGTHYETLDRAGSNSIDWEEMSRQGYTWYLEEAQSQKAAGKVLRAIDETRTFSQETRPR